MFPLFQDFDKNHVGSVSRTQFRRVLDTLELAPTETEWFALSEKFQAKVGGQHDVNYIEFCHEVYRRAAFTYRRP